MFVGLDMGGTHTDAVLVAGGRIQRHYKTNTDQADYFGTVTRALEAILAGINPSSIKRLNLSTTICTNAIVTGRTSPVGLLLEPGPGLNPAILTCGQKNFILSGSIDHRGRPASPLVEAEIKAADRELQQAGIRHLAIVGKFSTRNPEHELGIKEALSPGYDFITTGHRLSGRLNFPRRVFTAYLNSAVAATYSSFAAAIKTFTAKKKLPFAPDILKADGGTLSLEASLSLPVETILSGPAASIMGALALVPTSQDAIILDIGGTTTDIAFLAGGVPLYEPQGINLAGYPTLVRALFSYSLGLGGDSCLRVKEGRLTIGPDRQGPARALGGPAATPTDALITLGRLDLGDTAASRQGIAELGDKLGLSTLNMAAAILQQMVGEIARQSRALLAKINSRPVYTVREVLAGKQLQPAQVIVIGAPAPVLADELEAAFGLPVTVPNLAGVANAIGAALSQPTTELTLLADTAQEVLTVPEEGIREKIPASFNLDRARNRALELLRERLVRLAPEVAGSELEVVEEQSFNMVSGFYTTGKNIRVKVQVKPRVTPLKGDAE
ncbi:Hydantoinase/oxoprolinase [Moorella glycerini]|uniref:Acetophenone carboxylase alpha subunit n=1 Tax=Neomoorella stamsii TaxID=1266720 RepID=A0A9X7J5T0_9FIRM|nr:MULTISPECIES: hydantoinase/oxoprolinase family protein [Moorella]PRR76077.1 Acetophenone carboxylase alpha subunit [Moorella stamsii]CEP68317.1 Hydantoinase/oxoprolinase [Moorella glycerini]